MREYLYYQATVSVLTPLHIGNGRELMNRYDYAIEKGRTWRINEAALLDAQDVDDPKQAETLARQPPADLLQPPDFRETSPFFRYVIQGTPRSSAKGAILREQLKDPFDRLYLPGSSLKGALRTALAWYGWKERDLKPEIARLARDRRFAAQYYERELFGPDPNRDLLRALQVSDSQPVPPGQLMVLNVRVLNRDGSLGAPVEVEAVRPDTSFVLSLKVDRALYSDWARKHKLTLKGAEWLGKLGEVVRQYTQERIGREILWLQEIPNATTPLQFYRQLQESSATPSRFLLQLGWGTGWENKTFGSHLQDDPRFMERLVKDYRLARGRRRPGDPFPRSRRLAVSFRKNAQGEVVDELPAYPLGWAMVELKKA